MHCPVQGEVEKCFFNESRRVGILRISRIVLADVLAEVKTEFRVRIDTTRIICLDFTAPDDTRQVQASQAALTQRHSVPLRRPLVLFIVIADRAVSALLLLR